eukprot:Skav233365  [mRNA]  locus=scaffold394:600961:605091:- [translate_table: standard]
MTLPSALCTIVRVKDVPQMSVTACAFDLHSSIALQCQCYRVLTAFLKRGPDLSVNKLCFRQVDCSSTPLAGEIASSRHELPTRIRPFFLVGRTCKHRELPFRQRILPLEVFGS